MDPDEREQQVASLLAQWPADLSGVLIGGFAVAAYGRARYSEDVDILASSNYRSEWVRWLETNGLLRKRSHTVARQGGRPVEVQVWHHMAVSLDLMTGGLRDRESGVVIPEPWILRDSHSVQLELLSGRVDTPVNVVRLEGLWAMKVIAGRPQDLTDLFGIRAQPVNLSEVRELFSALMTPRLRGKLESILSRTLEHKSFADALSRLRLGSPELRENRSAWDNFVRMIEGTIPPD
ncbi:MAG: nucleotidyl transferase AbiEii/AbiGii toxin family protein [Thermoplasmata archaeon]